MSVTIEGYEKHLERAVAHYWTTLTDQHERQASAGVRDTGHRTAVTGGKQMNGFCDLIVWLLKANGLPDASIFFKEKLELPGYFRPTKMWDLLIVHGGSLLAAMEFKSQRGPSFGNNFNNRTEEAIGTAVDIWTAYREGAFGSKAVRPWLGWVMLLEETPKSLSPVEVSEPHFKVAPEFTGASYARRYEILLRRLVLEKHYNAAAFLTCTEEGGPKGLFAEPAEDLSMRRFLAGLAGHIASYEATIR
jgi:hypothetical protein